MPTLKSVTENIIKVNHKDLDLFIKEVTGIDYDCADANGWHNDSSNWFTVTEDPSWDETYSWNLFKEGKSSGTDRMHEILNGLCAYGHIKPGNYVINVLW